MDIANMPLAPKAGPFTKLLIKVAAADEETLRLCPPHDWDNARAVGEILIATWLYQSALFFIISHRLFAAPGHIRPELILAAIFIASFILLIDSYMVMRSGWHLSGIEELKRGGLDISGGPGARIKAGIFLAIRIFLSIGLAQLTAVFLSILIFGADISARIEAIYMQANAHLIRAATDRVDDEIRRTSEAVASESTQVAALSAQVSALRQNEIDPLASDPTMQQAQDEVTQLFAQKLKADENLRQAQIFASNELAGDTGAGHTGIAGDGPRHKAALEEVANATDHANSVTAALDAARARLDSLRKQTASADQSVKQRAQDKLPDFEKDLAEEQVALTRLKDSLASLTRGREEAIRAAVENAPDHVPVDNGLLAQITALEHIGQEDSKIAAVILLIDLTSFGFELAAVLAKVTSFVPTTYAALLARDAYLRVIRIVDELVADLNSGAKTVDVGEKIAADPPNAEPISAFDPFGGPAQPAPQPVKRPRGRPRKQPLN